MARVKWRSRFGIYLAAIGSAFGLGSLWRFPYVVAESGGGAFVIIYLLLVVLIGLPMLIGELLVGRRTQKSILKAHQQLAIVSGSSHSDQGIKKFLLRLMPYGAAMALLCCLLIISYYSVISGWILFCLGKMLSYAAWGGPPEELTQSLVELKSDAGLQLTLAMTHIMATAVVVAKDFDERIERTVGFMMPVFVLILGFLLFQSLNLDSSQEAIKFFLYPDLSQLSLKSLSYAVGQLCFTLSIGFATMVTFGSYLSEGSLAPSTGFRVATLDSATALLGGLLIFPIVFAAGGEVTSPAGGPRLDLLFDAIPKFFSAISAGSFFGVLFFFCLYLAAFGATLSLVETLVSNICENTRLKRTHAALVSGVLSVVFCIAPALSTNRFKDWSWRGLNVLEAMDMVIINWIVPAVALLMSQIVVYVINESEKRPEFNMDGGSPTDSMLYMHWHFVMKWVVPPVILVAFVLNLF